MNQDYKEKRVARRKRATLILGNEEETENNNASPSGFLKSNEQSDNEDTQAAETNAQSAIIENHRDKSRELAQRIGEENPNEIIEELHIVRDKIKDKIKQSLTIQLEKVRENEEKDEEKKSEEKNDELNLDLASARYSNPSETLRETSLQRIKQIKQQASMKGKYRLTGSNSGQKEPTRFDSDINLRDEKKAEKAEETLSARKKFQKIGQTVIQDIHMPNREEQFDFFTSDKFVQETDDTKKKTELNEPQTESETVFLLGRYDSVDTVYSPAFYIPHEKQKEIDNKYLFVPSSKNIPIKRKLGEEDKNPRYLESEGFYVGQKPYMTNANKNLMADRLLKLPDQRGMKWFGVDGELVALPDPIKYVSTRPSFNPTYTPEVETEFRKAIYLDDFANNLNNGTNLNSINALKYRIDLDINQVQFSYHHLFSAEHVLAFKLKNMFNNFVLTQEQNLIEILTAKIKALKEAEVHFRAELNLNSNRTAAERNMYIESTSKIIKTKFTNDSNISANDLNKLTAYRNEIKQARQQRDNEMLLKKSLTEKMLITWKELKDLRSRQQFRNTDLKLIIKKKEVNEQKEEKHFERDLKEELEELINEKSEEYQLELGVYEQKLKAFKLQKIRKEEAKKRQEQRANNETPANFNIKIATEIKEIEQKDLKILNEEDLPEPLKPTEVNKSKESEELRKKYIKVRKLIGEPLLYFELIEENGTISSSNECSREELNRRNKLIRTKVYVKIIFNGKLVFTTTESQLQNDFTVRWAQIFNIFMITFPDSILLQIFEYNDSRSHEQMISQINLPMPDVNCTSTNYNLENYEFSSSAAFYMHLKSSNQLDLLYTTGILKAGSGWGIDERNGNVLVPPNLKSGVAHSEAAIKQDEMKSFDAIAALGVSRMQDIEKLTKWIIKSNLDPNDPRNGDLISLIRNLTNLNGADFDGLKLPEHFRLDQMMSEFDFSNEEEIEKNKRFRLILLRAQDVPEFRGLKLLPIDERNVKKDAFEFYEKRRLKDSSLDDDEEKKNNATFSSLKTTGAKDVKNEIEEARAAGQKYIRKIREQILTQFKFIQSQKSISDIVIEEQVPNINALGALFYSLYVEPKRPLYPIRRERKKITGQNLDPDDVKILVNIVNAYDLPIRKDKITNDPMKIIKDPITGKSIKIHEHIAGESLVRPFVEVTFQETVYRTSTADGPNASWNHEIHLPFNPPNNSLKPESLQTCKDNIYFNIYDEVEIDALEDERDRDHVVHKKIMRYWLGTLKIPFSTVYFKSKIEGTFKIESPPLMLGYTRDPRLSKIKTSLLDTTINMEAPVRESSYLTLFITIEPQLLVPEIFRETYDSVETLDLLDNIVKWSLDYTKKYPTREFRPTVMNTDGRSVIITRYFRAIKPPPELIENGESSNDTTMNVARFVSLIPFVSDSLVFPGLCDVWSTNSEFLEILAGDEEEHSVLLVNFFLGLGKKAWLVIGSSITDGVCSYALTIENTDYTIWYHGQPYIVNEPHNPVKVVSAIVNDQNIWANIQPFHEPYRIKFDVNDRKCWMPFFTKANNIQLPSVQSETLRYFNTEPKFIKDLESRIENKLKEKLQEWRPRHITKYNRYGCSALRAILSTMEKSRNLPIENQTEPEELKQLESTFRISGFPINLPYTNMNDICEAVKATQVHAIPTSECEFALGVNVYPYPNTIMSIWVYIAVLTRKDRN